MKNLLIIGSLCLASTVIAGPGVPNISGSGGSGSGGSATNVSLSGVVQATAGSALVTTFTGAGTNTIAAIAAQSGAVGTNQGISYTYATNSLIYNIQQWGCGNGHVYTGIVTSNSANLFVTSSPFTAGSVGWAVKVTSGGAPDICVMQTNWPFGNTTWTITNNYDLVTTISAFVNASNVTLANVALHSTTNRVAAGADETAAITNAEYFAATNALNVTLFWPPGEYIVAAPIAYSPGGGWTNHYNAQITWPHMPSTSLNGMQKIIINKGPSPGRLNPYNNYINTTPTTAVIEGFDYGTNGGIMSMFDTRDLSGLADLYEGAYSFQVPGATYSGNVIVPYVPYSNAEFDFENLVFCPPKDSGMVTIGGYGAVGLVVKNCLFLGNQTALQDTGRPSWALSQTNGYAIVAPGVYNGNQVEMDNVDIQDYWNGFATGGNVISRGKLLMLDCWNGIVGIGSADGDTYQDYSPQQVKNEFTGPVLSVASAVVDSQDAFLSPFSFPNLLVQTNNGTVNDFSVKVYISSTLNAAAIAANRGLPWLAQYTAGIPNIKTYEPQSPGLENVQQNRAQFTQINIGNGASDAINGGGTFFQESGTGYWGNEFRIGTINTSAYQPVISLYSNAGSAGGAPHSTYFNYQNISGGDQGALLPLLVEAGIVVTNGITAATGSFTGNGSGLTNVAASGVNLNNLAVPAAWGSNILSAISSSVLGGGIYIQNTSSGAFSEYGTMQDTGNATNGYFVFGQNNSTFTPTGIFAYLANYPDIANDAYFQLVSTNLGQRLWFQVFATNSQILFVTQTNANATSYQTNLTMGGGSNVFQGTLQVSGLTSVAGNLAVTGNTTNNGKWLIADGTSLTLLDNGGNIASLSGQYGYFYLLGIDRFRDGIILGSSGTAQTNLQSIAWTPAVTNLANLAITNQVVTFTAATANAKTWVGFKLGTNYTQGLFITGTVVSNGYVNVSYFNASGSAVTYTNLNDSQVLILQNQ